ncbi:DNA-3-methyladenine glycosylase family protein [Lachnospiraceae bacterium LCP19S3_B12]|nr:DNA-3-methyladenine glycosylase 2 family protein [Lachnospiraceae bacterium OF09-33XD]
MVLLRRDDIDIGQICDSGQCFRMENMGGGRFSMVAGDHYLEIEQNKKGLLFRCEEETFESIWKDYFDLDTDYQSIRKKIDSGDSYLACAAEFGKGIRILRQDLWEMVITFIISQQNHIKRIRRIIGLLCEKYGERRRCPESSQGDRRFYDTFPGPERLAAAGLEELRECNLGYRARYVKETAEQILKGDVILEEIAGLEYPAAKQELLRCCGVGSKVADCICLFGLHMLQAFPVDTHIRQILALHYPEGFPFDRYQGYEGVFQQYLFYFDLFGEKGGAARDIS